MRRSRCNQQGGALFEFGETVDGSKIRRSPVEVGSLSQYLQGLSTIPGGRSRLFFWMVI